MSEFKTPGVFVEEVSKFPPSVAQVETAVPSFIGYTQKAPEDLKPKKITSLVEYEMYYGGVYKESIELQDTVNGLTLVKPDVQFLMYYSLQMYFANGGGPCYIISVGKYDSTSIERSKLELGLADSEDFEESTLVVFPDAVSLSETDFYTLYQGAVTQAETLKNRFVILDTYLGDSSTATTIGGMPGNTIKHLRTINSSIHAAAYFPHLKTVLNYAFDEEVQIKHSGLQTGSGPFFNEAKNQLTALQSQANAEQNSAQPDTDVFIDLLEQVITIVEDVNLTADQQIVSTTVQGYLDQAISGTLNTSLVAGAIGNLAAAVQTAEDKKGAANDITLKLLKTTNSELYNQIKKKIESLNVVLAPSSSIAGIYAKIDATKGVWKAPANVGLNYVVAPTEKISDTEQESLNVDLAAGKSVNAIRTFMGKGTLVWGARTFDTSGTEWKYISVRRLFDMIEKSLQNATERFVFEVNDASTWVRVKAIVENYLNQLWMSGALAGSVPEDAYQVKVGLNETMTQTDIDAGKMNIEIGIAAVRPTEFIVLRFSHKLQEA